MNKWKIRKVGATKLLKYWSTLQVILSCAREIGWLLGCLFFILVLKCRNLASWNAHRFFCFPARSFHLSSEYLCRAPIHSWSLSFAGLLCMRLHAKKKILARCLIQTRCLTHDTDIFLLTQDTSINQHNECLPKQHTHPNQNRSIGYVLRNSHSPVASCNLNTSVAVVMFLCAVVVVWLGVCVVGCVLCACVLSAYACAVCIVCCVLCSMCCVCVVMCCVFLLAAT